MIRLLNSSDSSALKSLRLISLQHDPIAFISTIDRERFYSTEYFQARIRYAHDPPYGIYGYFDNQQLLGYFELNHEPLAKQQHLANLYELFVHPNYRHQQIGSQLLNHAISTCRQIPLEQLHLKVNSRNSAAIHLYHKLQFKQIGSRSKVIKELDGSYQDELQFCYYLDQAQEQ